MHLLSRAYFAAVCAVSCDAAWCGKAAQASQPHPQPAKCGRGFPFPFSAGVCFNQLACVKPK